METDLTLQLLTYYELDLGLNHVTRKWAQETDRGANALVPVPGPEAGGPGGVLVLTENWVLWEHQDRDTVRTPIPRRSDLPDERGLLLISHAVHRQRNIFFVLAQSELGDLYKITLTYNRSPTSIVEVSDLVVKYFDTGTSDTLDGMDCFSFLFFERRVRHGAARVLLVGMNGWVWVARLSSLFFCFYSSALVGRICSVVCIANDVC